MVITKNGGVAVYVKKQLNAQSHEFPENNFEEAVWCTISLTGNDKLLIGGIYRSPNSTLNNNDSLLTLLHQTVDAPFTHLLIMGDFNYKDIDRKSKRSKLGPNSDTSKFFDTLQILGLHQHVTEPTRFRSDQTPSVLDLIISKEREMIEHIDYKPPIAKSDHVLLSFHFKVYGQNVPPKATYQYFKCDYNALRNHLKSGNWNQTAKPNYNIEAKWKYFNTELSRAVNMFIPKSNNRSNPNPAWINRDVAQKIHAKHKAWNTFIKHKTEENWIIYTRKCNVATKTVKKEKRNFDMKISQTIKKNPKTFWRTVRGRCKMRSGISDLINNKGIKASNDLDKAECLNDFFSTVFTCEDTSSIPSLPHKHVNQTLHTVEITYAQVHKLLSKLKTNKSPGPDHIHNKVLYEARNYITAPLVDLYRSTLDSGYIPQIWKVADVVPIHKKGTKTDPNNYRPVSLTSSVCKILETIIRDSLPLHLEKNNLYSPAQYGFRSGRSCCTQLLEVVNDWSSAIDSFKPVDVVYLDYRKAFDSVPHQRLLVKLEAYGIQGQVLSWIKHFLLDRFQRVVVNGVQSKNTLVTSGIPQGSVLGPIMFLIYVNDLPEGILSSLKLFADDTKIYRSISSADDRILLQEDLDRLSLWSVKWQLPFNINKCKVIHIGHNNSQYKYTMYSTNKETNEITGVKEENDLGVICDSSLNFSSHINECIRKANQRLGLIRRNFKFINEKSFLLLYTSLVRPIIEYCSPVWYPLHKKDSVSLEKVQRRATKLIKHLRHLKYPERLRRLNLPSLEYRRRISDLIQIYRMIHSIDDINYQKFFTIAENKTTRGHSFKIYKQRAETNIRKGVLGLRAHNDWNSLTETVVSFETLDQFKSRLDKHWANIDLIPLTIND